MIFDKLVWHWIVYYNQIRISQTDYYNWKLTFLQIRFKRYLLTVRMSDQIIESDYYFIYLDNANSIVKMVKIFTRMHFLIDKDIQYQILMAHYFCALTFSLKLQISNLLLFSLRQKGQRHWKSHPRDLQNIIRYHCLH